MTFGYTNPIRSMERKLAPDYASREFRDPGLRREDTGLGAFRHTMPHMSPRLRPPMPGEMRFQSGGANPVGQIYASSRPNLYNPDPRFRQVMQAIGNIPLTPGTAWRQLPASAQFSYQSGGAVPEPEDVMEPEDQQSSDDDEKRQIVLEAMAALDGQHPDAEGALKRFIDTFGVRALADLQQMVEEKHRSDDQGDEDEDQQDQQEEEQPDQEDDLAGAGGGLLEGPGTGQSDEIEGSTPSGRPVLLSDGEYVIDAPTVAALGDGSTSAGARRLDALRRQIRQDAYGNAKQAKPMARGGRALVLRIP